MRAAMTPKTVDPERRLHAIHAIEHDDKPVDIPDGIADVAMRYKRVIADKLLIDELKREHVPVPLGSRNRGQQGPMHLRHAAAATDDRLAKQSEGRPGLAAETALMIGVLRRPSPLSILWSGTWPIAIITTAGREAGMAANLHIHAFTAQNSITTRIGFRKREASSGGVRHTLRFHDLGAVLDQVRW